MAGVEFNPIQLIVAKDRLERSREEKPQRAPSDGQVFQLDPIDGGIHLGIKVVDPELVEVAKDDITDSGLRSHNP